MNAPFVAAVIRTPHPPIVNSGAGVVALRVRNTVRDRNATLIQTPHLPKHFRARCFRRAGGFAYAHNRRRRDVPPPTQYSVMLCGLSAVPHVGCVGRLPTFSQLELRHLDIKSEQLAAFVDVGVASA